MMFAPLEGRRHVTVTNRHARLLIWPSPDAPFRPAAASAGQAPINEIETLERVPIKWIHLIDKDSLKIKELEHVLIEKVEHLFRDML